MKTIKQSDKHNIILDIINKDGITHDDRLKLIQCIGVTEHAKGSKVYGVQSINTSVIANTFCKAMHKRDNFICSKCYAWKLESFRKTLHDKLADNRLIFNSVIFDIDELKNIPLFMELIRLSAFGELETINQSINYLNIANAHYNKHVTVWTKNTEIMHKAVNEIGKPQNMQIIQSSREINTADRKIWYADNTFTVYDSEHIKEALKTCSACNGNDCHACGFKCYYGTHEYINIAEIVR